MGVGSIYGIEEDDPRDVRLYIFDFVGF